MDSFLSSLDTHRHVDRPCRHLFTRCCFVVPAEDPLHGGREGTETAADGPGRGDEEQ